MAADEIIIETTSQEVIEVGVVGPQGPQGLQGPPGEATASLPWTSITGKPATFPPIAHTHVAAEVTDFAAAVAAVSPPVDWNSLTGKPGTFAPSPHTHGVGDITNLQTALDGKQPSGNYATLVNGLVPSNQLPSFVDDVLEYANLAAFPATGESGKIYVAIDTRKTYRWSGSAYVEISPSEVTSVAGRTGAITLSNTDISGLGSAATSASTDFAAASHNHAASAITSGVFDNARINFAAPSAIGAQIPNTGLFTDLSVTSRLNLPSSGSNAKDIWVSSGQVRYQAGSLITSARTLLSAEDNLSNLDNTATARTNLGVGSSSAVTFGSIQNTPIGSTTPAAGSFTNLLASAELTVPAVTPASPSTGDLYRTTDMLRYRDSSNTERILLNNLDNLANLGNTATARTNIGLGSANDVTFASLQNTPIGSTTASTAAFTTLSASTSLTLGTSGILSGGTNTIEQRNTTSAQTFRIYNTVSGAADADLERLFLRWSTNIAQIGTERTGTGSARALELSVNGNRRLFIAADGGAGIGSTTGLLTANGLYVDVPANNSSLTSPTVTIRGSNSVSIDNGGNNVLRISGDRLNFGGTTSSFPALKRSSTTLQVRLADDSAFAPLECGNITVNGTTNGTVGSAVGLLLSAASTNNITFQTNSTLRWTIGGSSGALVSENGIPIRFGGSTSSFPRLVNSGAVLQCSLADGSAYAVFEALFRAQGTAPATSGAAGTAGDIRYDADYIYVCTAANTWKRAAIATW